MLPDVLTALAVWTLGSVLLGTLVGRILALQRPPALTVQEPTHKRAA
jgi:hypothetical protein